VGETSTSSLNTHLGYFFRKSDGTNNSYDIPASLSTVIVTDATNIKNSFYECENLVTVILPNTVTTIGIMAFTRCTSLKSIVIPDSVTSMGQAFAGCTSLTSVVLSKNLTKIDTNTFNGCTSLTDVTIPEGITTIGMQAFADCTSLTTITIPVSVTTIERECFEGAQNLTEIRFQGTVEQWNNVSRGANWSWTKGDVSLSIICIDGTGSRF
jgi:hypothetical protein